MRIAKSKMMKGMTPQKMMEKLLGARILAAKKREGVAIWTEGEDKQIWLESVLGHGLSLNLLDGEDKDGNKRDNDTTARLSEIAEVEELLKLEERRIDLGKRKHSVNAGLDALAARTKLLQLAEDRVATLEPIGGDEEGGDTTRPNNKKSKGKKTKEAESTGQPRCGYDERLSWDDARFQTWSHTSEAKDILEERIAIDGTLCTDNEVIMDDRVAVCGRSKRKCKRHGDWSVIRGADMEVEREMQTNLLSSLTDEEQNLIKRIMQLKILIKEALTLQENKRRDADALLAKQLANEGTRRASAINGHSG